MRTSEKRVLSATTFHIIPTMTDLRGAEVKPAASTASGAGRRELFAHVTTRVPDTSACRAETRLLPQRLPFPLSVTSVVDTAAALVDECVRDMGLTAAPEHTRRRKPVKITYATLMGMAAPTQDPSLSPDSAPVGYAEAHVLMFAGDATGAPAEHPIGTFIGGGGFATTYRPKLTDREKPMAEWLHKILKEVDSRCALQRAARSGGAAHTRDGAEAAARPEGAAHAQDGRGAARTQDGGGAAQSPSGGGAAHDPSGGGEAAARPEGADHSSGGGVGAAHPEGLETAGEGSGVDAGTDEEAAWPPIGFQEYHDVLSLMQRALASWHTLTGSLDYFRVPAGQAGACLSWGMVLNKCLPLSQHASMMRYMPHLMPLMQVGRFEEKMQFEIIWVAVCDHARMPHQPSACDHRIPLRRVRSEPPAANAGMGRYGERLDGRRFRVCRTDRRPGHGLSEDWFQVRAPK